MIQLLGGGFVILATTVYAHSLIVKEKFRLEDLKEVERGILLLQNQVRYIGSPLGEILYSIGLQMKGAVGRIFSEIGRDMEERNGESGGDIWERIWMENGRYTYLTGIDLEEIISFGKNISFLERNSKESGLDLLLFSIRNIQEEISDKFKKNQKVYYSLGILSGLLLVVILI